MGEKLEFKTSMDFAYGVPSPVTPGIARIVAENPGPLTFKGTNTYLVGMTELAVIDPGPEDPAHREAILRTAGARPITHIVVTHSHRDHVDGAKGLQEATGAPVYGMGRAPRPLSAKPLDPAADEFIDEGFTPDVRVADGEDIHGKEWRLRAVHTPGHAPDHLCFALLGRDILFSGDHVMAWNTTLVAPPEGSMADYVASLETLYARSETLYLPGHGGQLEDPSRTVRAYLHHRRWREQSVLSAIGEGLHTIQRIVPAVYPAIDESLTKAAALSVLAHVEHLIERGLVTCDGSPTLDRPLALA